MAAAAVEIGVALAAKPENKLSSPTLACEIVTRASIGPPSTHA
jgi:hypothetical protein